MQREKHVQYLPRNERIGSGRAKEFVKIRTEEGLGLGDMERGEAAQVEDSLDTCFGGCHSRHFMGERSRNRCVIAVIVLGDGGEDEIVTIHLIKLSGEAEVSQPEVLRLARLPRHHAQGPLRNCGRRGVRRQ